MTEQSNNERNRLRKEEWYVSDVPLSICQSLVSQFHYAHGGSNTATYRHGLFNKATHKCHGIAWWIPPTKSAALATLPENWEGVLCLSRLVIIPDTPKNACSFLLSKSCKKNKQGEMAVLGNLR